MRTQLVCLLVALACLTSNYVEAKTVFRRRDKISENFKQLELTPEEIDPNVAPPEPQKVETIDPDDAITGTGGTSAPAAEDEVIDEAVEAASAVANEVIDESVNEVIVDTAPASAVMQAVATPVAVTPAAAASSASSSAAASTTPIKNQDDASPISKYCKCSDSHCDCCRTFNLPLIPVRGPGCAKITYLGDQKMSVSIKYGDITLATRTISGKRARPICMSLPGGYSKFCGRVYGLSKTKENFKACLGFELRAEDEVEAALRVSCFKFGPEGLRVAEPEPLPSEVKDPEDDEDDIFGFAAGGDDEDEDEDYDAEDEEEDDDDEADEPEEENDDDDVEAEAPEEADYGGFSLGGLLEELDDEDDEAAGAKPGAAAAAAVTPTVGQTRTVVRKTAVAQGKDDKGTEIGNAMAAAAEDASAHSTAVEAAGSIEEAVVTPASPTKTKTKKSKSKKAKKNKKKKAANTENDFAFEILNGILDFFN